MLVYQRVCWRSVCNSLSDSKTSSQKPISLHEAVPSWMASDVGLSQNKTCFSWGEPRTLRNFHGLSPIFPQEPFHFEIYQSHPRSAAHRNTSEFGLLTMPGQRSQYSVLISLFWLVVDLTPLKNDGVRQLG